MKITAAVHLEFLSILAIRAAHIGHFIQFGCIFWFDNVFFESTLRVCSVAFAGGSKSLLSYEKKVNFERIEIRNSEQKSNRNSEIRIHKRNSMWKWEIKWWKRRHGKLRKAANLWGKERKMAQKDTLFHRWQARLMKAQQRQSLKYDRKYILLSFGKGKRLIKRRRKGFWKKILGWVFFRECMDETVKKIWVHLKMSSKIYWSLHFFSEIF